MKDESYIPPDNVNLAPGEDNFPYGRTVVGLIDADLRRRSGYHDRDVVILYRPFGPYVHVPGDDQVERDRTRREYIRKVRCVVVTALL